MEQVIQLERPDCKFGIIVIVIAINWFRHCVEFWWSNKLNVWSEALSIWCFGKVIRVWIRVV